MSTVDSRRGSWKRRNLKPSSLLPSLPRGAPQIISRMLSTETIASTPLSCNSATFLSSPGSTGTWPSRIRSTGFGTNKNERQTAPRGVKRLTPPLLNPMQRSCCSALNGNHSMAVTTVPFEATTFAISNASIAPLRAHHRKRSIKRPSLLQRAMLRLPPSTYSSATAMKLGAPERSSDRQGLALWICSNMFGPHNALPTAANQC
mmetsp:Transcript_115037/g.229048  ORF Transcript_115037/g.229048 Transcript_115037/m.229048 type:complete len:204 (-) Transcript_115037:73-684(-)